MENTVPVQVCNTVTPSLIFHTGGMFVILINVSIFRMSIEKKVSTRRGGLIPVEEQCVSCLGNFLNCLYLLENAEL